MTIKRMDHVGVVVEDLEAAVAFFVALGLELEGETTVEGEWADQLIGLDGVRADIAFLRTSDGHGRVEVSTFQRPVATSGRAAGARERAGHPSHHVRRRLRRRGLRRGCAPTAPSSWAWWRSTRTSTATPTSAALPA